MTVESKIRMSFGMTENINGKKKARRWNGEVGCVRKYSQYQGTLIVSLTSKIKRRAGEM